MVKRLVVFFVAVPLLLAQIDWNTQIKNKPMVGAGPGALPTIDQAIASCGSSPCIVTIAPGYTGPESTSLFTTSTGYKVFTGVSNITVQDMRSNETLATAPVYPVIFGGRSAGSLNRLGVHRYCHSVTDSCDGFNAFGWLDGSWPSNGGLLAGATSLAWVHDTATVGSSASEINAHDAEVHLDATSADNPIWSAFSFGGAVLISRTGVTQNVLETSVFRAKGCNNQSPSTATIFYCYGANLDAQPSGTSGGLYRNFSLHSRGDALWENGTKQWATSADTAATISTATEAGQTATFTMTTTCAANPTFVAGATVAISGVSLSGYNTQILINASGCSGSSFSGFLPGTNNLASGSGGSAQTLTPRVVTTFQSSNTILHQPLLDANGWRWQTQAGANILGIVGTGVLFYQSAVPASLTPTLGQPSLPWSQLVLGNAANQTYAFTPLTAAANRTINIPDPGSTVNLAFNLTATSAAFATATTAGTCVQNTTAVANATTSMVATASPVSTPGVGAQWSAFVSSAGNVTINECAVATSAGGTIAFNIRVTP